MISFRRSDLLEEAVKNRVYDVFFYVWFVTSMPGVGGMEYSIRDHSGRFCAYLEVFFPYERLSPWENEAEIKSKIKKKIEDAIGQPISQRIYSKPHEDMSAFYETLKENFETKLKSLGTNFDIDSMISHGMVFRMGLSAT